MYISKCPHDIHGLLCRCRSMVIFHQIKLFGMLSNELTAFNTLVDVVADAAFMNKDHSNALCCPVKLNTCYFTYSHTNSLHTAYGKHKKCQHSKKKIKMIKIKPSIVLSYYHHLAPSPVPYMNKIN